MHQYQPVLARTSTVHRPVGPVAYDCVKVIVVRDGSAILFSEFGQKAVKVGDVILLGANVLCGSEPEGHITVTTVYLDTDYVLDQVRWQYAGFLEDRLKAQGFAETIYTEPAQICEGFRFLFHGFGIYLRLRAARRKERRAAEGQTSSPGGHEALSGDEHGSAYLGRTPAAPEA